VSRQVDLSGDWARRLRESISRAMDAQCLAKLSGPRFAPEECFGFGLVLEARERPRLRYGAYSISRAEWEML